MKLLKNISYTISSNLLSILASVVIVLIIPKFIGVHEYGLWQIFTFYAGYVGILHFGWADGIFLRRGGQRSEEVEIASLKSETVMFVIFNCCIGLLLVVYGIFFAKVYHFIIMALGLVVIVANIRTWITMILQAIGDFRGYAVNLSLQSLTYLVLIGIILFFHLNNYKYMIMAFVISQMVTSISGFIQLNRIFGSSNRAWDFTNAWQEAKLNITAGFKLMIANSTALLIVGVIRMGIQKQWSVSVFGKVSLVLSIVNLITVFINAVSLVLFPTLRRSELNMQKSYVGIRSVLMPLLYLTMILYFPIQLIIPVWLPKYADIIQFTAVLVPMMIYQGKFEILSNTFMKNLRMEFNLMVINITTLGVSVVVTIISTLILHNLTLAIFSIAFVMGVRSVLAEVILSMTIHVNYLSELLFENVFVLGFMVVAWQSTLLIAFVLYLAVLCVYIMKVHSDVKKNFKVIRQLAKY